VFIQDSPYNQIGGSMPEAANVIVGNVIGVGIYGQSSVDNLVRGNLIGELKNGSPLGNTRGVFIQNSGPNSIGGTGAGDGNTIAHNDLDGVGISAIPVISSRKAILSNNIYANGGLGIDLGVDGVTLNDNTDPDTGANQLQNYPVLQSTEADMGSTPINGTLNSTPNTGFRIQLFANESCDPTGFGEGQTYLAGYDMIATTDGSGNAAFGGDLSLDLGGKYITATATDPDSNTSEFSACIFVQGAATMEIWGDIDCLNGLTLVDGLVGLKAVADLDVMQSTDCPGIGMPVLIDDTMRDWGDWDCNQELQERDALNAMLGIIDLSDHSQDCPVVGTNVSVTVDGGDQ
jgi:hypothetical protein